MIDPTRITKFDRTEAELEEMLLFCVAVAGKTAKTIAQKVDDFLKLEGSKRSPFEKIRCMAGGDQTRLVENLKAVKLGRYKILSQCYSLLAASNINLKTCSIDELEDFPGIGPKTSRFFVLHSRPKQQIACLDTHILSYLRGLGHKTPKSTPSGKKYRRIEKVFVQHAASLGRDIAELDLEIWNKASSKRGKGQKRA